MLTKIVHGSVAKKIVASDLQEERDKCNFDQEELWRVFNPRPEENKIRASFEHDLVNIPELQLTHKYYEMTPKEIQEMWQKKINFLYFNHREKYFGTGPTNAYFWMFSHHGQAPVGLHLTMFLKSMQTFSTDEQKAKWIPKIHNLDILGCYAQTEIGHGSNVAGLETTATFDKKTNEFIINTPSQTANKWWPGELGRQANYALVMAQLVVPEDDGEVNTYGTCPFLVQLRDLNTHKHMPGVQSGDIGPKIGYHGKDNGWASFDNVRIPNDQMLQKFISVDTEGCVSINGDLKVLYSTMVFIRCHIAVGAKWYSMYPLTIGLRYSAVRRQFKNISGQKQETKLLDYQTQQMKLFPLVATLMAHGITSDMVVEKHTQLMEDIKVQKFKLLDILHHYTSGIKAVYTQDCMDGMYLIRQSLGGAGFTAWSGIPRIIEDYSPQVTYEGDNTVMAQQCTSFLFKQAKKAYKGKDRSKVDPVFGYLNEMDELHSVRCSAKKGQDFLNLDLIEQALKVKVASQLRNVMEKLTTSKVSKKDFTNIHNGLDLVKVAEDHIRYVSFYFFRERINKGIDCPNLKRLLELFCMLYGLNQLNKDSMACFETGYFSHGYKFTEKILDAIKLILAEIRPQIIPFIESFKARDDYLQSAIGNSYGDIYEQHLKWAKESRLNTTTAGDAIPDGWLENMQPVIQHKL